MYMKKILAITLSVSFTILTVLNGLTQEQKDPFKKEIAGKGESIDVSQPQQLHETSFVSVKTRMIEIPRRAADELFKEQYGPAKTFIINEKTVGAISNMVVKSNVKALTAPDIMTQSGSPCTVKCVEEYVYASKTTPFGANARDCGIILRLTPTIDSSGKFIDIVLNVQSTRVLADPHKVAQPVFLSKDMESEITIPSGNTLVLICDAISDQEKQKKADENILLVIVTASIVPND
jgi:type II secretory pathway component GspD/PulD (secretin)